MRRVLLFSALVLCFNASTQAQATKLASQIPPTHPAATAPATSTSLQAARASFAKLPLSFEENAGQTDSRVKYTSRGAGYNLFLTADEAVFALRGGTASANCATRPTKIDLSCSNSSTNRPSESFLWIKLLGANSSVNVAGADTLPGRINYYLGSDPRKWRAGVRQYGRVNYEGIYPGIDLTYYGNQQQLESDFVVAPGANPRAIEFEIKGARDTRIDAQGNLVLATNLGNVQLLRPGIYQIIKGVRHEVPGRYALRSASRVGFVVGPYDRHEKLIIDPTLVYSTFLGGSGLSTGDVAQAIALASNGHAYVTGQGGSSDFPGTDQSGPPTDFLPDFAFVTEFDATGSSAGAVLVYSTILSGSSEAAIGNGIGVDSAGKAYVAGMTSANDFPMVNPFQSTYGAPNQTGFVAGLATDGTLIYSTYLGGRNQNDTSEVNNLAVDSAGNAYIAGDTSSQNFPTVSPLQAISNSTASFNATNAIVAKFNPQGQPIYSTYLGGNGTDVGNGIAIDSTGNAYVTGSTGSSNFPIVPATGTSQAFQTTFPAGFGVSTGFVSKLNPAGSALVYSTYLGGDQDLASAIAVDSLGNAYITGQTNSGVFPALNQIASTKGTGVDTFVTMLNPGGTALVYSTQLGGSGTDIGLAISLDGATPANVFVTGSTTSADFPTKNPLQSALGKAGATNAFVTEITGVTSTATPPAIGYSTYLGGYRIDQGNGIAASAGGNAYVAGKATSPNFPVLSGGTAGTSPFQNELGSSSGNAFVAEISPAAAPSALNFFPPSFNFHDAGVGQSSAYTEIVTLSNNSASNVTINAGGITVIGANASDFTQTNNCPVSPATFAAGALCTLNITFSPSDQNARTAQISVASSAPTATMNLSGTGGAPQVSLDASSITFFPNPDPLNVPTSSSVTVTNTGGGTLLLGSAQIQAANAANAAPFAVQPNSTCFTAPIAPSASCSISLSFIPTAAGTFNATLLINDNVAGSPQSLPMTGAGKTEVVVAPTSIEFGAQVVNSTSTNNQGFLSVQNGSGVPLTLTLTPGVGAFQGDFHINNVSFFSGTCTNGMTLAIGATCDLDLYFQPTGAGNTGIDGRTGSYTIGWTGSAVTGVVPGSQLVNLMGTAVTGILLYTNSITAPNEFVGFKNSFAGLEYLANGTNNPITVSIALSGNNPGDFTVTLDSTCAPGGVVPANTYCRVDPSFSPTAVGLRTATATFSYTGVSNGQLLLSLSGTGIPGPVIITTNRNGFASQTSSFDFGSEIISTTTPEQVFQVRNAATVPLTISSITAPGNADFHFTPNTTCAAGTIPGGGSCFIAVTFTPSTTTKETTTFVVTDSYPGTNGADASSPHTITLTGTGEPAVITVSVSTGTGQLLDFGNVALNPSPVPQGAIYLTNAGNAPTTISWTGGTPALAAGSSTAFSLITSGTGSALTTCTQGAKVVPQGGNCVIGVTFNPTTPGLTGTQTASLTFSDSLGGSHVINIQGNGVPQGKVQISPSTLNFNQVAGPAGSPQAITLTNTGTGPLTITSAAISDNSSPANFVIASGTTCTSGTIVSNVAPNNSCIFNITFAAPATTGSYFASLQVQASLGNNARSFEFVSLQGTSVTGGFTLSPAGPINFGAVAIGSTANSASYTLTNQNPGTVTFPASSITVPANYSVTSDSCSGQPLLSGNACFFGVSFTPTTAGAHNGNLQISFSGASGSPFTVAIQGSGSAALVANPNPVTFQFASVGNTSFGSVTIANGSPAAATITAVNPISGANAPDFSIPAFGDSCTGQVLPPSGGSCFISLNFLSATAGTFSAQFTVSYTINSVAQTPLTVTLNATIASAQAVIVAPTPPNLLVFPSTTVNTQSLPLNVVLSNSALATASLSISSLQITGNDFAVTSGGTCQFAFLSAGQSCTLPVTFTPSQSGTRNGTLTITDNSSPATQTVSLQGSGVAGAVTASPTTLVFPLTNVGSSVVMGVVVSNTTGSAVPFTGVTYTGAYSTDASVVLNSCSTTTPIGSITGTCVVYIKFTPTGVTNNGQATIHYGASGTIVINVSGAGANPVVTANPNPLIFATGQLVNTSSAPQAVTLSNGTSGSITISSTPTINGDFQLGTNTCTSGAMVTAGSSCTVNVIFRPTTTGTRTGTLTIADSPDGLSPHSVSLSGTGVATDVTITKSHAGNFTVGQTGTYTITVTNVGGAATTGTTTVTDTLPTGMTFNSNTNSGVWSCSGTTTVTCTTASVIAATNGTSAFNLVVNVASAAAGTPTNTASVTTVGDTGTTNKSSSDPTTVSFPLPTITLLSPTNAIAGAAGFTLTVNGTNFVSGSVVHFNGAAAPTTFVSATQLTATITAAQIAAAGSFNVTVTNPAPGGGTSASSTFTVNNPSPTVTTLSPSAATVGGAAFTLTVNGTNFNHSSAVTFNGTARTTTFVSATQLTIQVTTADIAALATLSLSVTNPAPGGGTSGTVTLPVTNPPPVVTSISPTTATAGGAGFTLSVNGSGFVSGASVNFNGNARATTFVNSTQVTAAILAGDITAAGTFNVNVTNPAPGGGTSGNATFTVNNPLPTIASLSPTSTLAGGASFSLTVNGTNFNSSSVVTFNGAAKTTTFVNGTQITAGITAADIAAAGTFNVTVTNPAPGGGTSGISTFTANNPAPTITSLSPTSATTGGAAFALTVNGTGFVATSSVKFNGVVRTTTFVSATQVTAAITAADIAAAGSFNVTVTNPAPGGGTSANSPFAVNNPLPAITSLSPSSTILGGAAFTLTVNGSGFVSGATVSFNGNNRVTTFVSATKVTVAILATDITAAGSFNVAVTNPAPGGGQSGNSSFTVNNPLPAITSLSPASAIVGGAPFTLTVNGTNFISGSVVNFNGNPKTTTFVSATQITAAITAADILTAGPVNVTVTNPAPGGGTSGNSPFAINNPAPTITSLSPNGVTAGGAGFTLTVNGTNFLSSSVVNFNGTAKATTFVSSTKLTASILSSDISAVGSANVTVTNPAPGGGTTTNFVFTIASQPNPVPTLTSISPTSGVAGQPVTLTLTGTGFIAGSIVNFGVNGDTGGTASNGGATITITIPAGQLVVGGPLTVTVTNPLPGGGTSAGQTFTVNNPVPTITTLSPTTATVGGSAFTLTVNGTGFVSTSVVNFNGVARTPTFVSSTQLTATITSAEIATVGSFPVTVTNPAPGGGTSASSSFGVNNPAPSITSLSPNNAIAGASAFTLTVSGTGFVSGSVVNFNGTARTTTFVDSTHVTAAITAPDIATAGTLGVTVTNPAPGGGTSASSSFTVNNPLPSLSSLSPTSALAGGSAFTLTVNGTNFNSSSVVTFNGTATTTTFVSATQVTAAITMAEIATAGSFNVTVTNPAPGGGTSGTSPFAVNNPVPSITSLSPTSATAGTAAFTLTVNGTNFVSSSVVNFNGTAATTTFVSATKLTASITPAEIAAAGSFNVTVTNLAPGGGTSGPSSFTVNNPVPTIASLSPASATKGSVAFTLTVNGTNFAASSVVNFNGVAKTTTFVSATQLTAAITAPDIAAAGTFNVTVTNPAPGGGTSGNSPFAVNNPVPTITSLSPAGATVGGAAFTLTVNGTGFLSGATVNFNGNSRTTTFVSATQLTAAITVADITTAGTFNVTVINPAPTSGPSTAQAFSVSNPLPTITSLSPASTLAGEAAFTLTVNGTNFVSSSVVNFNGTAGTTTFVSPTQLTVSVTAPQIATAGPFNVSVTSPAPGGGTSANTTFSVNNPVPTITSLSPASATKGAAITLTVTGTNFNASSVLNFNGAAKTTTFVSATQVKASITAADTAAAGTVNVTVTNPAPGGGTTSTSPFQVVGLTAQQDASTPGTITVNAGTPATVKIDFMSTPANTPLPSALTVGCNVPQSLTGATCSANPATIPVGTASPSTTITITATPTTKTSGVPTSAPRNGGRSPWSPSILWFATAALLSMMGMLGTVRQRALPFRRAPVYLTLVLLVLAAGALSSCTSSMSGPAPTPVGPATITVTATTADGATLPPMTVNINVTN